MAAKGGETGPAAEQRRVAAEMEDILLGIACTEDIAGFMWKWSRPMSSIEKKLA